MGARSVDVFILAGGKSERMGVDKATMIFDGRPLICRVVEAAKHLGSIHIVGGAPGLVDLVHSHCRDVPTPVHIADSSTDPGPFGAVVGALGQLSAPLGLFLSCDLAALTTADVDRLIASQRSSGADYVVPLVGGERQWHGLCLSSEIIPRLTAAHDRGVRSMRQGFAGFSECTVLSSNPTFFIDVDSPEDLRSLS